MISGVCPRHSKALATEIATLKKIHDLWKATLRENTAASEENLKQVTFLK